MLTCLLTYRSAALANLAAGLEEHFDEEITVSAPANEEIIVSAPANEEIIVSAPADEEIIVSPPAPASHAEVDGVVDGEADGEVDGEVVGRHASGPSLARDQSTGVGPLGRHPLVFTDDAIEQSAIEQSAIEQLPPPADDAIEALGALDHQHAHEAIAHEAIAHASPAAATIAFDVDPTHDPTFTSSSRPTTSHSTSISRSRPSTRPSTTQEHVRRWNGHGAESIALKHTAATRQALLVSSAVPTALHAMTEQCVYMCIHVYTCVYTPLTQVLADALTYVRTSQLELPGGVVEEAYHLNPPLTQTLTQTQTLNPNPNPNP